MVCMCVCWGVYAEVCMCMSMYVPMCIMGDSFAIAKSKNQSEKGLFFFFGSNPNIMCIQNYTFLKSPLNILYLNYSNVKVKIKLSILRYFIIFYTLNVSIFELT